MGTNCATAILQKQAQKQIKENEHTEKAQNNPFSLLHKHDEVVDMKEDSVGFTVFSSSDPLVHLLILFSSMDLKYEIIQ